MNLIWEEQDLRKAELLQQNGFHTEEDPLELASKIYQERIKDQKDTSLE